MILRSVKILQFAGLREIEVGLSGGITIVLGPNEAGKSTLLNAISHSLLTSTGLTPARFRKTMDRFLPRPAGDAIEVELEIGADADARFLLTRRWGAGARTTLLLPDGGTLSDEAAESRLEMLLPVRPGTLRTLFLVEQASLHETFRLLNESDETRDELFEALRRQGAELGGVSVEAFARGLQRRMQEHFSRWDAERERPERGRGIDDAWERQVGRQLAAFYAWKRLEAEFARAAAAEEELAQADSRLESARHELRETERFLKEHEELREALTRVQATQTEIDSLSRRLDQVRAAIRRWPVATDERVRTAAQRDASVENASEAEALLENARSARELARRRAIHRRVVAVRLELQETERMVLEHPTPDRAIVARLGELEQSLQKADAALELGSLRVRVTASEANSVGLPVKVASDGTPGDDRNTSAEGMSVSARRNVRLSVAGLIVEAESGEESFADLTARRNAIVRDLEETRRLAGVRSANEAQSAIERQATLEQRATALRGRLIETLEGLELEELLEEFADQPDEAGDPEDEVVLAERLAAAREERGAAEARLEALDEELGNLESVYGSQDALEDELATLKARIRSLESERERAARVPDAFESEDEFLLRFEERSERVPDLREREREAFAVQAERLARLGDQSSEELLDAVKTAEVRFRQEDERGRALQRVREAAERVRAQIGSEPVEQLAKLLADYLQAAAAQRFAEPELQPGVLTPNAFAAPQGPALTFSLLSHGTRDIVGLCVRLALARSAALGTPMILDDPLVEMDADRRAGAARAIRRFAEGSQVILLTCHPEHAALFPEARLVRMDARAVRVAPD